MPGRSPQSYGKCVHSMPARNSALGIVIRREQIERFAAGTEAA